MKFVALLTLLWAAALHSLRLPLTSTAQAREEIEALARSNRLAYQACMNNLRHQFTPGYRARDVLHAVHSKGQWRLRQSQGLLRETRCPYDLAIDGEGFFLLSDGSLTRDGSWILREGQFWLQSRPDLNILGMNGKPVEIPDSMTQIEISADGMVRGVSLNGDGRPVALGRILLVRVPHPEFLEYQHPRLMATPASKPPFLAQIPGSNGMGVLAQGYLEMSNVDPIEQMETALALRRYAGLLEGPSAGLSLPSFGGGPSR